MTYNTNSKPLVISKKSLDEMPESFVVNEKEYKTAECVYYPYSKAVCQIVLQEVPVFEEKEITYEELCAISSERGKGGFGSSNK